MRPLFADASRKVRPDRCLARRRRRSKCNLSDSSSRGAGIQNRAKWRGTFAHTGAAVERSSNSTVPTTRTSRPNSSSTWANGSWLGHSTTRFLSAT